MKIIHTNSAAFLIFLIFATSTTYAQQLDKDDYYKDGLTPAVPLKNVLPYNSFQFQDDGDSESCYAPGSDDNCAKIGKKWSVKNAYYEDLSSPIPICICEGLDISFNTIGYGFGQVPQFLRKLVKSLALVPEDNKWAVNVVDHITVFTKDDEIINEFVHEAAHSHDGFSSSRFSLNVQEWAVPVVKDTCVPDNYAKKSLQEDYAQNMVVFLYKLWKPNDPAPDCMKNQQNAILKRGEAGLQNYINEVKNGKTATTPTSARGESG